MYEDLFITQNIKNLELAPFARYLHECARNTAREQAAGAPTGISDKALSRQNGYLEGARSQLAVLFAQPEPDVPQTHPMLFEVDLSFVPEFLRTETDEVVNDHVKALCLSWQRMAKEAVLSASAGRGGGYTDFDEERMTDMLAAHEQNAVAYNDATLIVDFAETTAPAATPKPRGARATKAR